MISDYMATTVLSSGQFSIETKTSMVHTMKKNNSVPGYDTTIYIFVREDKGACCIIQQLKHNY